MKNFKTSFQSIFSNEKLYIFIGIAILLLQIIFHLSVNASPNNTFFIENDSLKTAIKLQLNNEQFNKGLNFPKTVKKLYERNGYNPYWLQADTNIRITLDAMLLFDCTSQYGLNISNYHPNAVNYTQMYVVFNKNVIAPDYKKADFDLKLSDAIISMINHLHFGRFNPNFKDTEIDDQDFAINILTSGLSNKNLTATILAVQPQCKAYQQLQYQMRLIAGQYICDSYQTPDSVIRKIIVNLERLRWINWQQNYVHINIPSYTLNFNVANRENLFKVIVGKPSSPTPTLESEITHFSIAPNWKVPQSIFKKELIQKALKDSLYFDKNHFVIFDKKGTAIAINKITLQKIKQYPYKYYAIQSPGHDNALGKIVFRFNNNFSIYLHDSPEKELFKNKNRAFSHGCIRVADAEKLAELMLQVDHQENNIKELKQVLKKYTAKNFMLKKAIPIYVTYLTCGIEDGLLSIYTDVYDLDLILENLIFKSNL